MPLQGPLTHNSGVTGPTTDLIPKGSEHSGLHTWGRKTFTRIKDLYLHAGLLASNYFKVEKSCKYYLTNARFGHLKSFKFEFLCEEQQSNLCCWST
jgi:hypothetical protein